MYTAGGKAATSNSICSRRIWGLSLFSIWSSWKLKLNIVVISRAIPFWFWPRLVRPIEPRPTNQPGGRRRRAGGASAAEKPQRKSSPGDKNKTKDPFFPIDPLTDCVAILVFSIVVCIPMFSNWTFSSKNPGPKNTKHLPYLLYFTPTTHNQYWPDLRI